MSRNQQIESRAALALLTITCLLPVTALSCKGDAGKAPTAATVTSGKTALAPVPTVQPSPEPPPSTTGAAAAQAPAMPAPGAPGRPTGAAPLGPLDAPFVGQHAPAADGYASTCSLETKSGALVMTVGKPPVGDAGAIARCCVVFRSLDPGGRTHASISLSTRAAEPQLSAHLESYRGGLSVASFSDGPARPGKRLAKVDLTDPGLSRGVDKFCVSVGGKRRPLSNQIKVSGLRFE